MKQVVICLLSLVILSCNDPEPRKPISQSSGSFIKTSAERNKKLNEAEEQLILEVISRTTDSNFIASESGFWYRYDQKIETDSITPQFGDLVNYDHEIQDINGNVIYSREELGNRNYQMDQEELFSGLREGLKLMKPGEAVTFLFPSQKAYGYYGDEDRIGTNLPIKCIVTLNTITKTNETN